MLPIQSYESWSLGTSLQGLKACTLVHFSHWQVDSIRGWNLHLPKQLDNFLLGPCTHVWHKIINDMTLPHWTQWIKF